jgi:hypothetical protein
MSYEHAERVLAREWFGKTAFRKVRVGVLEKLCKQHGIEVRGTGLRGRVIIRDYTAALMNFVRL